VCCAIPRHACIGPLTDDDRRRWRPASTPTRTAVRVARLIDEQAGSCARSADGCGWDEVGAQHPCAARGVPHAAARGGLVQRQDPLEVAPCVRGAKSSSSTCLSFPVLC
jgi:hypothetical protein